MRLARPAVLTLLFAALVAGEAHDAAKEPAAPSVTNLMKTELAEAFTPDREVIMDLVEVPAGAVLERHWHPGEEFHYYLEGEGEIQFEDGSKIVTTPGTAGHVPYKAWHKAVAGKKGAKLLVVRIHTKGEPVRYTEEKAEEKAPAQD